MPLKRDPEIVPSVMGSTVRYCQLFLLHWGFVFRWRRTESDAACNVNWCERSSKINVDGEGVGEFRCDGAGAESWEEEGTEG